MLNIMVHGYNGAMGKVVCELLNKEENATVLVGVDINATKNEKFSTYSNIKDVKEKVDVIIDFAHISAVDALLDYSRLNKIPLVLCTTGLDDNMKKKVNDYSSDVPILMSANMSLGINLILNLVKKATEILYKENFDIEIIEKHHNRKLDAPSGTALAIATAINKSLDNILFYEYDRHAKRQKRDKKEIGISSVRGGNIVGEHEVIFAGEDEIVSISHSAYSRNIFAKGAISAAKFLAGKEKGLYCMDDIFN